jgi:hypothetical protein
MASAERFLARFPGVQRKNLRESPFHRGGKNGHRPEDPIATLRQLTTCDATSSLASGQRSADHIATSYSTAIRTSVIVVPVLSETWSPGEDLAWFIERSCCVCEDKTVKSSPSDNLSPVAVQSLADRDAYPVERVLKLLAASPRPEDHASCGISARPCRDCRSTGLLECSELETCGRSCFCRPCAATWRCRLWRRHLRHVREFHVWAERYPVLANLHPDATVAAALVHALRCVIRRDVRKSVWRRLGRELPAAVLAIVSQPQSRRRKR